MRRLRYEMRRRLHTHPRRAAVLVRMARLLRGAGYAARLEFSLSTLPEVVRVDSGGGVTFLMHSQGGRDQIARDLYRLGWHGFERPMPDLFALWARANPGLVLDVGANTGFYSLLATASAPDVVVHAFEPLPPVAEMLRSNILLNRAADRITDLGAAVSDHGGEATLYIPDDAHGLVETSSSLNPASRHEFASQIVVPVTTLDDHVGRQDRTVSLMKIDVEALDHLVLSGATSTLAQHRPLVFFELLPHGSPEVIEAMRQHLGYVGARLYSRFVRVGAAVECDGDTWNQALVPEERRREFEALAGTVAEVQCVDS